jgi:hypothetical protein
MTERAAEEPRNRTCGKRAFLMGIDGVSRRRESRLKIRAVGARCLEFIQAESVRSVQHYRRDVDNRRLRFRSGFVFAN